MNRYRKGVLRKAINQLKLKKVTKDALFHLVTEIEEIWEMKVDGLQTQLTTQEVHTKRLAEAAHGVIQRTRRLNKPHLMELWNALKPFDVIPVAVYVNPQEVVPAVQPKGPRRGKKQ